MLVTSPEFTSLRDSLPYNQSGHPFTKVLFEVTGGCGV